MYWQGTFGLDTALHDQVEGSDTGSRNTAAHQEEARCSHFVKVLRYLSETKYNLYNLYIVLL